MSEENSLTDVLVKMTEVIDKIQQSVITLSVNMYELINKVVVTIERNSDYTSQLTEAVLKMSKELEKVKKKIK